MNFLSINIYDGGNVVVLFLSILYKIFFHPYVTDLNNYLVFRE